MQTHSTGFGKLPISAIMLMSQHQRQNAIAYITTAPFPWRIHGAGILMLTWLGYIDGIHVTIYSSTMDPMGLSLELTRAAKALLYKSNGMWSAIECAVDGVATCPRTARLWNLKLPGATQISLSLSHNFVSCKHLSIAFLNSVAKPVSRQPRS